jgi:hypothetical protein
MGVIVEPAKAGAHGFDTNVSLTKASATALKQAGFAFAIRYLTRKATPPPGDLTKAEMDAILDAGLALMAVQHVAAEGWTPTEALGTEYGTNAAAHAKAVNLPAGTVVFLDLEGVKVGTPAATIIAYCNNWHAPVKAAGYLPGLYVGPNSWLTADQLYHQLKMTCYWKSGSKVPPIPTRGYCMVQSSHQEVVAGVNIDHDQIMPDGLGQTPPWARKAAQVAAPPPPAGAATAPAAPTPAAPSPTAANGEQVLRQLAAAKGVAPAMERLLAWRAQHKPDSNPRYWAVINFDLHSSKPRLFLFDRVANACTPYLCAHGKGSEGPSDDGFANVFSNVDGSNASSLGIYSCGTTYVGENGRSLYLDGEEATNSNARHRHIVIHGAAYVSPTYITKYGRIGRSHGCPAIERQHVNTVLDALQGGSLLIAWKS